MSKRFGRNQRRKMREKIAWRERRIRGLEFELQRSRKSEGETTQRYLNIHRRLRLWAEDVAKLMGDDHAFNEQVRRMTVEDVNQYGGVLELYPRIKLEGVLPDGSAPAPATAETIIRALIWRLRISSEEFNGLVRIELQNRYGEPVGYALPKDYAWMARDIEYLAARIAGEMVAHINNRRAA